MIRDILNGGKKVSKNDTFWGTKEELYYMKVKNEHQHNKRYKLGF